MTSTERARETRIKNQEAQMALLMEKQAVLSAARLALTKVFESEDATPAEILRAGELLAELNEQY